MRRLYLGHDLEWDEAVITLILHTYRQSFFVLPCYRGLPSDGLIRLCSRESTSDRREGPGRRSGV